MIERAVVEYIANALWQVPLLAGGAWLFLWAVRPGPRTQHGVWLAVLGLAVLLPVHGMGSAGGFAMEARQVGVSSVVVPVTDPVTGTVFAPGARSVLDSQEQVVRSAGLEKPLVKKDPARWDGLALAPRVRRVRLSARAVDWLVGAYGTAVLFGVFRVSRAWWAARRLVEDARETTVCLCEMVYLEGYGERLGVRLPQLRESCAVSSPMIVGLVAPVLLLPEGFGRHTQDEVRAALCHELAHVKRRDYLVNLLCQVVALPVGWHPVTYAVQQRIRRTREMVCDAMAAREMQSEISYARCLLALARSMLRGGGMGEQAEGLGLFGNNILEERVMRLTETKTAMSVRAKLARAASGATMMIAATAMAGMFHVIPTMAAETGAAQSAPAAAASSAASAPQAVPAPQPPSAAPEPAAAPPPPAALPAPAAAPTPPPAPPAPAAAPAPDDKGHAAGRKGVHVRRGKDTDGSSFVIVNGEHRELTPEEKSQVDKAMAEVRAKLDSPEFRKQMADAQKQAAEAAAKLNSPEFKRQMEDAQRQARAAKDYVNSPEFSKQMADAQKEAAEAAQKLNGPDFKKQMEEAERQMAMAKDMLNNPEFKKQIEDAHRQMAKAKDVVNSPEFKRQMEEARKQVAEAAAKINSPEFKEQMEEMKKQFHNGEMQREIDDAMRKLNETPSHDGNTPVK